MRWPIKLSLSKVLVIIGLLVLFVTVVLALLTFGPAIKKELGYIVRKPDKNSQVVLKTDLPSNTESKATKPLIPVDETFGIVIPKIGANASIVADVDANNSKEYQVKLTKGVAHAKGTPYPDQPGNTFLFAHSSDSFINANIYNSVFYLLNKMEIGDEMYILYKGQKYKFLVTQATVVNPEQVEYMKGFGSKKTLTLMTCWPAGTTYKRLVVVGELAQ